MAYRSSYYSRKATSRKSRGGGKKTKSVKNFVKAHWGKGLTGVIVLLAGAMFYKNRQVSANATKLDNAEQPRGNGDGESGDKGVSQV
jgi:hypothetical protein